LKMYSPKSRFYRSVGTNPKGEFRVRVVDLDVLKKLRLCGKVGCRRETACFFNNKLEFGREKTNYVKRNTCL
jgi:hypothetical protein